MAISLVQTKSSFFATPTTTAGVAFTSSVVAGNAIIVFVRASANTSVAASDNLGNTYTNITGSPYNWNTNDINAILYAKNITGGACTVTVTLGTGANCAWISREYSGLDTTAPFDVQANANGSNSVPSSGATSTTSTASELVVASLGEAVSNTSQTVGTGYGNLTSETTQTGSIIYIEDKTVSSTGAQTGAFGTSHFFAWACMVTTFKASSGPTTGPPTLNNYQQVKAPSGISVSEKIK